MADVDRRAEVIALVERERAWWAALVADVGEDRMTEPGPMGEWTFKDLAAHLLGWRNRTIARLEAVAAGQALPAPAWPAELDDDDSINAWIQARYADRSVREVLDAMDASYERLADAVAALPEDVVERPGALPWIGGASLAEADLFSHIHEEHWPSIEAWLATRG